jgi:hypothetical protein
LLECSGAIALVEVHRKRVLCQRRIRIHPACLFILLLSYHENHEEHEGVRGIRLRG